MTRILTRLASLRLTLLLIIALVATSLGAYKNPDIAITWVTLPMAALGLNLIAAIISNPHFRQQPGLLLFHNGLLVIIILSGLGILTSMEGHIEISEGQAFNAEQVVIDKLGPWHHLRLDELRFIQGDITVDFNPSLRRDRIQSQVWVADTAGKLNMQTIGDGKSLQAAAYRLLTTSNKGYALLLSWIEHDGSTITGTVHLPSYPANEWKQESDWITPAGEKLSLQLTGPLQVQENASWSMNSRELDGVKLQVSRGGSVSLLSAGELLALDQGTLKFEGPRIWMGYRIDYNPMLIWQLLAAILTVAGLAHHFWHKFRPRTAAAYPRKLSISQDQILSA